MLKKNLGKIFLIFSALLPLLALSNVSVTFYFKEYCLTVLFLLTATYLWQYLWLRVFSMLFILLWVLNIAVSYIMQILFSTNINIELASIILATNPSEILGFIREYTIFAIVGVTLFLLMLWLVARLSQDLSPKFLRNATILLVVIISYKFGEHVVKGQMNDPTFSILEKIVPYSSLNNMAPFVRAQERQSLLNLMKNNKPHYQLSMVDTDIDTYVIVLGESARRANISLYGYINKTTPNIDAQEANLYIFKQAIANSPTTTMSLSTALTIKEPTVQELSLLSDNIINLANQGGFETYWYSRQGFLGQHETVITLIAENAKQRYWLPNGYDGDLLTYLDKALAQPTTAKKLIVLHTNGSHLSACNQYPDSEAYFTNGESSYENCYNNSIRYMDKVLGEIFQRLEGRRASVLYFSDHGQRRRIKYNGNIDYVHGAINPTKESVDVPQFIWFSPKLMDNARKIGVLTERFPLSDNYYLIADWLGINKVGEKNTHSPFSPDYRPRNSITVVDTHQSIFDYNDLKSDAEYQ